MKQFCMKIDLISQRENVPSNMAAMTSHENALFYPSSSALIVNTGLRWSKEEFDALRHVAPVFSMTYRIMWVLRQYF